MTEGYSLTAGALSMRLIKGAVPIPLSWRLHNWLRWPFIKGMLAHYVGKLISKTLNVAVFLPELRATLIKADGRRFDLGVLGYNSVTTAFCTFMVDQFQTETSVWGDFKYHDSGIGTTAENVANTDIETTDGEARATGTQAEGSAVIYQSVGTIAYTTTKAITEHGLFNTTNTTTLLDRTVFAAVNVVNGDSIQFTYSLTATAGG